MTENDWMFILAGVILLLLGAYVVRTEMRRKARARLPVVVHDPEALRKRESRILFGGIAVVAGIALAVTVVANWDRDWAKRTVRVTYWGPGGGGTRESERAGDPIASKIIHIGALLLGGVAAGLGGATVRWGYRTKTAIAEPPPPGRSRCWAVNHCPDFENARRSRTLVGPTPQTLPCGRGSKANTKR